MRPLIVPAPDQSDQELAQMLTGLAKELGLLPDAIATDTGGPRLAYRVDPALYDAWLVEQGTAAEPPPEAALQAAATSSAPSAGTDPAGVGVEGSATPAAPSKTSSRSSRKATAA